jgi:hypothetical protein
VIGCLVMAAFVGNAWTAANTLQLTRSESPAEVRFDGVSYDDRSWRAPVYYAARIGGCLPAVSWLDIEAEFIHLKTYANPARLGPPMPRFAMSHGLNFVFVNAAARIPTGRVTVVLRAGAGPTVPHVETSVGGRTLEAYQFGSPAWQAAAGLELPVWRGVFAAGEAKWTRTRETLDVPGGSLRGVFSTRHLVAGVGWRR